MRFLDAHCHLADRRFAPHIEALLEQCAAQGIYGFIQGGIAPDEWQRQIALAQRHRGSVLPVFGLHPWHISTISREKRDKEWHTLEALCASHAPVGIGETGLDFGPRFDEDARTSQREMFIRHIGLARALNLPLVLHVVGAHEDVLKILDTHGPLPRGGLVHGFTQNKHIAGRYLDHCIRPSFGVGVLRRDLTATLRSLPPEAVLIESDAPDQAPPAVLQENRGTAFEKLNVPWSVRLIARHVADARQTSEDEVLAASARAAAELFDLADFKMQE